MDIYRELILDHYKHPRNFGHLDKPDVTIEEGNVTCGDRISIEIKIGGPHFAKASRGKQGSGDRIEDVRFSGEGCAISQASASLLTEKIKGMKLSNVLKLTTEDILTMLGTKLTPSRTRCAVLALQVAQKAIGRLEAGRIGR